MKNLDTRFNILKLYCTLVIICTSITAFLLKNGESSISPNIFAFLLVLYFSSFFAGIVVIEFLIQTHRSNLLLLDKLELLRHFLSNNQSALLKEYEVKIEKQQHHLIHWLQIRGYFIDIAYCLCFSQLALITLCLKSNYGSPFSTIQEIFLGIIIFGAFYFAIRYYIYLRINPLLETLNKLKNVNKGAINGEK